MKKLIVTTVIATCLALYAAVWPQNEVVEETPAPTQTPAVCAPETTVAELKTEVETVPPAEKEKVEVPQSEPLHETIHEPEPVPMEVPAAPKAQPTPEAEPASESTPAPNPVQTLIDPQPGDMVYVAGFGWLECQEPGEVTYAEDMYENGNKIGSMG